MVFTFLYVASIVFVNWAFSVVPVLHLPGGELWSPVALVVGFTFVLRDFAQRSIGHGVLPAMFVGGIISWFMATPQIALASVCAFALGESFDWLMYTVTKRPFSQRILLSSLIGTPIDSLAFLLLIGAASLPGVLVMTLSKMVGAFFVFWLMRRRERMTEVCLQ